MVHHHFPFLYIDDDFIFTRYWWRWQTLPTIDLHFDNRVAEKYRSDDLDDDKEEQTLNNSKEDIASAVSFRRRSRKTRFGRFGPSPLSLLPDVDLKGSLCEFSNRLASYRCNMQM
ncbi:uncharacterized protein LOC132300208 [Cornus florida]|uniref:uncharacterized protein LOC132300208 n=1 Tax=Cornus florida TaxID=4283 RepID=UPI0028A05E8C|nr:uncharacterized protein LOC132300208 [Cornus florida]